MGEIEVVTGSGTGMLADPAWDAFARAEGTVFHTAGFLLSWWRRRPAADPSSRLLTAQVLDDGRLIGICAFELSSDLLRFAGGRDVVDYMGPAAATGREKEVAAALCRRMFDDPSWRRLSLAGLAQDDATAQALIDEVVRSAPGASVEPYDQAPRIEAAPGGYLQLLNAKRRADVLRKRHRLAEVVGEVEIADSTPSTVAGAVEQLLRWKAAADPAMAEFVAAYGDFVRVLVPTLAAADAARVVELRADGRPLASAVLLRNRETEYIYNMAYDLDFTAASPSLAPGVVLVSLLVERALDAGRRFDFLKGAQDYKLRLGGVPVNLFGVAVER